MIDFRETQSGELDDGLWFSDLFMAAVRDAFTGGVLVTLSTGPAAVVFRQGNPVHASGAGFQSFALGQLLVDRGVCDEGWVRRALSEQSTTPGDKPLLGAILERDGLNPNETKRAIQAQTSARLGLLIEQAQGPWQAAPGEDPRVKRVGVELDGWMTLFDLVRRHVSSAELRQLNLDLLGSSVLLTEQGAPEADWTEDERKALKYLKRPRNPEHLEKAFKRRPARVLLRVLKLFGRLAKEPKSKAIAIHGAVKISGVVHPVAPSPKPTPPTPTATTSSAAAEMRETRKLRANPMVGEIKELHGRLDDMNLFEVLGVTESSTTEDISAHYRQKAKRFHADALPLEIRNHEEISRLAREIWTRTNEAHETLTDSEKRREYIKLLNDERFKGDARKAIKAAEANRLYEKGLACFRKSKLGEAREYFQAAYDGDPSQGLYQAYLAYSTFADRSQDRGESISYAYDNLKEAIAKAPKEARIHFYLGKVLKEMGREEEALKKFNQVLRLNDPMLEMDANTEVRLLKTRLAKEKEKGSSPFGRLFSSLKRR